MTVQPLVAGFLGGWEILLVLSIVVILAATAVVSLLVIAFALTKKNRAAKVPTGSAMPGGAPSLRS